jgi:PAS domain S-box-containing protein
MFIIMAVSVFVCEALVMIVISLLPTHSTLITALFDSTLLVIILSPLLFILVIHPLTRHIEERKRVEGQMEASEYEKRAILDSLVELVVHQDRDMKILWVNQAACDSVDFRRDELIGRHCHEIWNQLDEPCPDCPVVQAIQTGQPQEIERYTPDGRAWYIRGYPVKDETGIVIGGIELCLEITERKRAQEALAEEQQNLQTLFNTLEDFLFIVDSQGRIIQWNPVVSKRLGYSEDDLLNLPVPRIHPPDRREEATRIISDMLAGNGSVYSMPLMTKDGEAIPVETKVTYGKWSGMDVLFGISRDITERKLAEETLRQSEKKYRDLYEGAPNAYFSISASDGSIVELNSEATRLLGYDRESLIGMKISDLYADTPNGLAKAQRVFERFMAGESIKDIELQMERKDGQPIWISLTVEPVSDQTGNVIESRSMAIDISMRKRLEAQLIQAQKMEAIGTLAGGVAHDFNNLLMGIEGNAALMLLDIDSGHPHHERLKNIEQMVKNASDLTKQLLGFARGGKYEVRSCDLNEVVKSSSHMFGRTKKEIAVHEKYQEGIWSVEADRSQIEQVLMNLYVNAWQAMPSGGELYLQTQNVTLEEKFVQPYGLQAGRYVKVSVTDTGIGMDEATQQRIFDPFFTTKEMGRGTGLGLASAYGIIKNHGGVISVYSKKGQGATFDVYLPVSGKPLLEPDQEMEEIPGGTETILFVDDEDMVVDVGKDLMEGMGYEVITAHGGKEALDLYQKDRDKIHLVVLDMIMPDMGGGEVFDRLRELNPKIKVLLSSGYSINGKAEEILERGCNGFIQKPFNRINLSKKLREILDSP